MDFLFGALLFGQHPGFLLVDILVGAICQRHDFPHRLIEFPLLVQFSNGLAIGDKIFHQGLLGTGGGESVVKSLAQEAGAAAGYIDDLAHHVRIYPLYKVLQVEIDVVYR